MKTVFRIPQGLLRSIHADLDRPHAFAGERVGFISCRQSVQPGGLAILAEGYHAVADQDYVDDPRFGAAVSGSGFRKMLSLAYGDPINVFHVHRHECRGLPSRHGFWIPHSYFSSRCCVGGQRWSGATDSQARRM